MKKKLAKVGGALVDKAMDSSAVREGVKRGIGKAAPEILKDVGKTGRAAIYTGGAAATGIGITAVATKKQRAEAKYIKQHGKLEKRHIDDKRKAWKKNMDKENIKHLSALNETINLGFEENEIEFDAYQRHLRAEHRDEKRRKKKVAKYMKRRGDSYVEANRRHRYNTEHKRLKKQRRRAWAGGMLVPGYDNYQRERIGQRTNRALGGKRGRQGYNLSDVNETIDFGLARGYKQGRLIRQNKIGDKAEHWRADKFSKGGKVKYVPEGDPEYKAIWSQRERPNKDNPWGKKDSIGRHLGEHAEKYAVGAGVAAGAGAGVAGGAAIGAASERKKKEKNLGYDPSTIDFNIAKKSYDGAKKGLKATGSYLKKGFKGEGIKQGIKDTANNYARYDQKMNQVMPQVLKKEPYQGGVVSQFKQLGKDAKKLNKAMADTAEGKALDKSSKELRGAVRRSAVAYGGSAALVGGGAAGGIVAASNRKTDKKIRKKKNELEADLEAIEFALNEFMVRGADKGTLGAVWQGTKKRLLKKKPRYGKMVPTANKPVGKGWTTTSQFDSDEELTELDRYARSRAREERRRNKREAKRDKAVVKYGKKYGDSPEQARARYDRRKLIGSYVGLGGIGAAYTASANQNDAIHRAQNKKKTNLSATEERGMIELSDRLDEEINNISYGSFNFERNSDGQFSTVGTQGATPEAMASAYGTGQPQQPLRKPFENAGKQDPARLPYVG